MPAITYSEFDGGLDRRLPVNVQQANRLWVLRNAYITSGKKIRKRPALKLLSVDLGGSYGLESVDGELRVFCDAGSAFVAPILSVPLSKVELDIPPSATINLTGISYADLFQGFLFVVGDYGNDTFHHYIDGATTYITDVNCPHTRGVTKAASRIFAPSAENVKYCKAGDPRDWTTASDAGFLPAGLQQDTKSQVTGCGTFRDKLVVGFPESLQLWDVAVDPSANKISQRIEGTGTTEPLSFAGFANDLAFLSPFGFRSVVAQQTVDRIDDVDVGVPVDSLVQADIAQLAIDAAASTWPSSRLVRGVWIHQLGQYWAFFQLIGGCKAWVYSYSKTSKLACWSEYTFYDFTLTDVATLNGKVYLRSGGILYELDPAQYVDNGGGGIDFSIDVEVQMAFQDAKTPGVNKYITAGDFVLEGSWDVSYKYDPRDQSKETIAQTISGDTRPGELTPVEVSAPAIAPVFRHSADEAAEIDAITLYYENLGIMG